MDYLTTKLVPGINTFNMAFLRPIMTHLKCTLIIAFSILALPAVSFSHSNAIQKDTMSNDQANLKKATFGGGCFWCVEAVFQRIDGVDTVLSGYSGGKIKNPSYREVSSGRTGHAEVVQITYDANKLSYDELLKIFFKTHDPTQLNRQGPDVGPQYRSAIFYHDDEQKEKAEYYITQLEDQNVFDDSIKTEVSPYDAFYKAEDYHQNFYNNNKNQGYCQVVIVPKLDKLEEIFSEKLKDEYK